VLAFVFASGIFLAAALSVLVAGGILLAAALGFLAAAFSFLAATFSFLAAAVLHAAGRVHHSAAVHVVAARFGLLNGCCIGVFLSVLVAVAGGHGKSQGDS
jgi:hypothetical protein